MVGLNSLGGPELPADVGVRFVRDKAAAMGLPVAEVGGTVYLTEGRVDDELGSRQDWVVGIENAVVLFRLAVHPDRAASQEARDWAEQTVPLMIRSLRK
jgi:hypothetical protein